ncbi:preprotein translocase subunit SecG [Lactobacillus sp. S2-2]|uniref:preprotein translocase subunit SecG n=1 Tax=Lactobacillus sp. S2-2 TaxID=2692917 RepID=UPI001F00EE08|nr:preprotein translocase subunit SecG [Lactobacillus sp. S2-2]MCF6515703.1 preprotein translocase subunit SecG [Lactobacillus sp. S2-2]
MNSLLMVLLWIVSILIIGSVLLQPSKNNDAMSSLSGGADDLFSDSKPRGFEAFMQKVTAILGIVLFGIALILMWLSAH